MVCVGVVLVVSSGVQMQSPTLSLILLRNVAADLVWMEDSPPLATEALYYDSLLFQ